MNSRTSRSFDLQEYLSDRRRTVDEHLDQFLPPETAYPAVIHQAMRYSIFAGGKRLRPILALATGEALDGDFSLLIRLACALEMIHTYSLIHDDLPAMDNDDFRRGLPTAHRKFGEGIAILAGNGLLTRAFEILSEIPEEKELAPVKLQVIQELCRAIGTSRGVIAGQVVDLQVQGKSYSRQELEFIHSCKTGALIRGSIVCASILCRADPEVQARLGEFGAGIGLAFQIVDDILDIEGSSETLGKTSGKDRVSQKATYPALFGLPTSRKMADRLIEEAILKLGFLGPKAQPLQELAHFICRRTS